MGILHVTKKKVPEVLTRRLIDGLRVSRGDFSGEPQLAHGENTTAYIQYIWMHQLVSKYITPKSKKASK